YLKKGKKYNRVAFLSYIGLSLLMGDGVITPAITLLSAVEGIPLIPGFENTPYWVVLSSAIALAFILFAFQSRGTDKVSTYFGPVMVVWFSSLFIFGLMSIIRMPSILQAVNPYYAYEFLAHNGVIGYFILSEVFLCATGGEALYADMGHLGAKPIRSAWLFVFVALVVNYFGQGVYILESGKPGLFLFEMVKFHAEVLYVPFLILTIMSSIVASQAMISAVFSLVFQGINTRIFPLLRVKYTSTELKSQIYIGSVNWGLFIAVILMMLFFRQSANIAAAYGLAVTMTMSITGYFMILIFKNRKDHFKVFLSSVFLVAIIAYLGAMFSKFPHGGYWSLVLATIPLLTTLLWLYGQKSAYKKYRSLDLDTFKISFEQLYTQLSKIKGNAIFFTRNVDSIPAYMVHCIISSSILYEKNILVAIQRTDEPHGQKVEIHPEFAKGLSGITITAGYMEIIDLPAILKREKVNERVIFYGVEDIQTNNIVLKMYAIFKKFSPNFVQFYDLPSSKIHGVVTRLKV
ncbi:MAG: KUP/HAK/KT family potassium transporter, partial [Ignavibacteriaceae bacterium]|nr:KUP/HAK/KT family potassium transporter [Ignavibacteriaceae bacterium]